MRREFLEVATIEEAQANCPWAAEIVEVDGGFMAFESMDEYNTWANAKRTILTKQEAFELGRDHGNEMANDSNSNDAGCDGWDGMLINADPSFVREKFGWDGCDSSDEAKELLAEYCRGCQAGADAAVEA